MDRNFLTGGNSDKFLGDLIEIGLIITGVKLVSKAFKCMFKKNK